MTTRVESNRGFAQEVAPPGWEGTVKAMKHHPEIDNPWALAWAMKDQGDTPHHTAAEVGSVDVAGNLSYHDSEAEGALSASPRPRGPVRATLVRVRGSGTSLGAEAASATAFGGLLRSGAQTTPPDETEAEAGLDDFLQPNVGVASFGPGTFGGRAPASPAHPMVMSETYVGFANLQKGGMSGALAAYIGRKKYGAKKFNKAAAKGKKLGHTAEADPVRQLARRLARQMREDTHGHYPGEFAGRGGAKRFEKGLQDARSLPKLPKKGPGKSSGKRTMGLKSQGDPTGYKSTKAFHKALTNRRRAELPGYMDAEA